MLTMAAATVEAADPTLQMVTLFVSSIAALSGITAVVIGSRMSSHESKNVWLREEQIRSYESFTAAAWAGLDEIAGGATQAALDHPEFLGLGEARVKVASHTSSIIDAYRKILVVGGEKVVSAAGQYFSDWSHIHGAAVPLPGTAHEMALHQRLSVITQLTLGLRQLSTVMRDDLKLLNKKQRKIQRKQPDGTQFVGFPRTDFSEAMPGEANAILQQWLVRTWDGVGNSIGPSYVRNDTPWGLLKVRHRRLLQPLIAVLRKSGDRPWMLAIDSALTLKQIDLVERDAASIVVSHGHGPTTHFGGNQWLPGETTDERLYWWTLAEAPPSN
ncbi:hypothetical protein [Paeniglutamicibacter terrestris]|uniref:Uncharacterized protein n=1 Tax=Paeniglutamicibacter terrestris TaxID=2723403 RepID=A0ABX1G822_9MICC|nr:hypothetical protein [Paeniglutamicibacter terrestris]NKG22189.1 hypothetical protein [Paeniglutamicibacter terrestris]